MTGDVIRVVLADDHSVVRAGLKAVLGVAKDIEVIGEAKSGREAVMMAERFKPDVIVMDLSMPDMDGTAATKEIVQKELPVRVLILTMHAEEDYLVPLMEAGAAGYLVKSAADKELVDAVRAVAYGDVYVRPAAARVLAKNLTKKDPAQSERHGARARCPDARGARLLGARDWRAFVHQSEDGGHIQTAHSGEAWADAPVGLCSIRPEAGVARRDLAPMP
jgi:DNA-binding NarL/FixJ family response regulator